MAQYQQLSIEKFSEGMVDEYQLSRIQYPEGSCVECENVIFMPTAALKKRQGYYKLNSTVWATGSPITKVYGYTTTGSPGTEYALAFSCSSSLGSACIATVSTSGVGSDVAAFVNVPVSGTLTASWAPLVNDKITVETYAGSAIITNWSNPSIPVIWPGTSTSATCIEVSSAPSGAKCMAAWGNYLFLGNVLDTASPTTRRGSRIMWNTSSTIDSWPTAQYIDLDADDGDEITAMCLYKNTLIVFKRYKMFQIHYIGGQLMFQDERIAATIGCVGPNAYIESGGSIYFIGEYTAYEWKGSGEPTAISDKIQSQWDKMNVSTDGIFDVESDDSNWLILFSLATLTSTTNNVTFGYDTRFKSWTRFVWTDTIYCIGGINYGSTDAYQNRPLAYSTYTERIQDAKANKSGVLILGGAGYLYSYGNVDADDTKDFTGYWTSRWLDFGLPHSNKRLLRATAFIEREGTYNLHMDMYVDWDNTTPDTQRTVSMSGSISKPMVEQRCDFTNQFRATQFKVYTDALNEPFTLHRLLIDWVPKGKTLVS